MNPKQIIPVFRPSMDEEEIEAVAQVLRSGWLGLGPRTQEFEQRFAQYIGIPYAVALNSGTAALHLSLNALGITSGEVITSPITFVSTAHAILYMGAQPVFADVQEDTLNIDPRDIERKITPQTRALIPIHYGGHSCDMDEVKELAHQHSLYIIEDAAHACGGEYQGKKAGALGDLGCFSFHAVKNLATGDGGMITTRSQEMYNKLLKLRWLGISRDTYQRDKAGYSWYYEVEYLGFKCHMNDITAALGLVQLKKLERLNARREEICQRYNKAFKELEWIMVPVVKPWVKSARHNYVIQVLGRDRNQLLRHLGERGISASVHYLPLYLHPFYRKLGVEAHCPVADKAWTRLLTLPLYPDMTDGDIERVVEGVRSFGK